MWQRNHGQKELEILQNRFTAYLSKAIQHCRNNYLEQACKCKEELMPEEMIVELGGSMEQDIMKGLPLMIRLENNTLFYALKSLSEKERRVFLVLRCAYNSEYQRWIFVPRQGGRRKRCGSIAD